MKPWIIIVSFFVLLFVCMAGAWMGVPEARGAVQWIAGAMTCELAHMARRNPDGQ
jgi:hypothetical protein